MSKSTQATTLTINNADAAAEKVFHNIATHYAPVVAPSVEAEVEAPEAPAADDKASKLAAMLAAAGTQAKAAAAPEAPKASRKRVTLEGAPKPSPYKSEDGTTRQKRNYEVTTRKIVIFKSDTLNAAFISTNLAYTTKTYEGAIKHALSDLAPQKRVQPLLQAEDFRMEIMDTEINVGDALNDAKGKVFDEVKAAGWDMLCNRPRTSFAVGAHLAPQEAPAAEEETVDTAITETEVAELAEEFGAL